MYNKYLSFVSSKHAKNASLIIITILGNWITLAVYFSNNATRAFEISCGSSIK